MNDKTANYWIQRYDNLNTDFSAYWSNHMQRLADYILPRKSTVRTAKQKGADLNELVYDSTAIHANDLLAARMQASLTPSSNKWFQLRGKFPRQYQEIYGEDLNDNTEVKRWFDECSDEMFAMLNASNFATVVHEMFLDLGCFGTANMSMEGITNERGTFDGFKFQSIPIEDYVFSENTDGKVDVVIRKIKKTARQALQRYDKKRLHPSILEAIKKEPEKEFQFIHAVFPQEDFDPNTKIKNDKPFGSIVIDYDNKEIVEEAGYDEHPFMVTRWSKSSGEKYGRGPGRTAIDDIKVLNMSKKLELRAWTKVIDPPLMVEHDAVLGGLRITPNSIIYVRDINRRPVPFEIGSRWDIGQLKKEELVSSVKRIFYSDQLQFPEQEAGDMTAREVMVRYELMQSLLGSTFGRIVSECLDPLIERMFSKMDRTKMLPTRPAILADMKDLKIGYTSPLAMAQKAEEAQSIDAWLASTMPLAQADPTVMDVVDLKEVVRLKAELLGVPAKVIRSKQDEKDINENRAMMQTQQMESAQNLQEAETLNKMAPFMREANKMTATGETP